MKYRILVVVVIILIALLFLFQRNEKISNNTVEKEEPKETVDIKKEEKVKKKEQYEPIPIIENSDMLFETPEEAERWAQEQKIEKYEIKKCEWKWENSYKDHGLNGVVYYTVKILK